MTKNSHEESNKDKSAPSGCVNERLNYDHPKELIHEEISHHDLMRGPFQLQVYLEKSKKQYLNFIYQMRVIFLSFFFFVKITFRISNFFLEK